MKKVPALELALLVAVLALGLWLRGHELASYRLSPDDGNYLYSARVHRLERDLGPAAWLREDVEWAFPRYYPHSYLHQGLARWWYRLGLPSIEALRINSVATGLATALLVYLFYAARFPARRPVGLLAAALVAVQCFHVWYSRTGWGQTGCTAFWFAYFALGWALLRPGRTASPARDALLGAGMAVSALLAYGFHEMISVHVVGMGLAVLACGLFGERTRGAGGVGRRLLGLLVLRLLFDSFARQHWINFQPEGQGTWWDVRRANLRFLFALTRIDRQLGYPVLGLALVGLAGLARRDRAYFVYVATSFAASFLIFAVGFKDFGLERIYLPTAVLAAILAAEGLATLAAAVAGGPGRRSRALFAGVGAALVLWAAFVTQRTLFGQPGELGFERVFHAKVGFDFKESRDAEAEILAHLRARLRPDEAVGVAGRRNPHGVVGEFSPLFRLLDEGLAARPFGFTGDPRGWPRFVVGVRGMMERDGHTVAGGGYYREVAADTWGRIALYARGPVTGEGQRR